MSVAEVEYSAQPELHRRYKIDAAPITVLVDAAGVTRGVVRRRVRGARAVDAPLAELSAIRSPMSAVAEGRRSQPRARDPVG